MYRVIAARRADPNRGDRNDVLSMLLEARDEDGEPLTDGELRDELMGLVLAGHETTANSLAWAFERLLRTPDAYDRLRDEVRSGDPAASAAYVEATIHETMRSRPVIPIIVRSVKRRWRFGEYVVGADTPIAVSIIGLHHRDDVYPRPQDYRPERFLNRKPGTYTWIPFGGGIRRCLGATLAMAEQRVMLAAIARRTDLAAADPAPEAPRMRNVTMIPGRGGRIVVDRPPKRVTGPLLSPTVPARPSAVARASERAPLASASTEDHPASAVDVPTDRRERLIDAMAASIEEKGYRDTTVADVVRLARTSRRSFYEHFEDRDACFLALFDATNDAMMRRVAENVDPARSLDAQVDAAVDGYISSVTEQPTLFASFVRELPGLGQAGAQRSGAALERFAKTLDRARRRGRPGTAGSGPATVDDGHRPDHRRRAA